MPGEGPSCDWGLPGGKAAPKRGKAAGLPAHARRVRLMRYEGEGRWRGVRTEAYKREDGTWAGVVRRTLIGARGEGTKFHLRYFEVSPGGETSHEAHGHEHVVVCVRGRGRCLVRGREYEIGEMDTLYIPPEAPHRLSNPYAEPFGFFCLVDAERDRPRPVPHSITKRGGAR